MDLEPHKYRLDIKMACAFNFQIIALPQTCAISIIRCILGLCH